MSRACSISVRRAYGLQRVCRVWGQTRSTVYARRSSASRTAPPCRRGPVGAGSDEELVSYVRRHVRGALIGRGHSPAEAAWADTILDPEALTIGFARRFATYKRATLLFEDRDRLKRLLLDRERPVQVIFAGKAHPADEKGKRFLQVIFEAAADPELRHRVVVLDDLITTGASKLEAIAPLEELGLQVEDVVVLIDREQGGREYLEERGYRLHAVFGLGEMLEVLAQHSRISTAKRDEVKAFLAGSQSP